MLYGFIVAVIIAILIIKHLKMQSLTDKLMVHVVCIQAYAICLYIYGLFIE